MIVFDPNISTSNLSKHGVTFNEAYESIHDPNAIWLFDTKHSDDEDRFISIGLSHYGKLLFTVYTMREKVYRIISARLAEKDEEELYCTRMKRMPTFTESYDRSLLKAIKDCSPCTIDE